MVEPTWSWTLHRHMPSSVEAGHKQIEQLLAALTSNNWDGRDFFHVQMAAEEAMVNAVKHGNAEDVNKSVEVEFKVSKDWVYVRFRDQGKGFKPELLPDPREGEYLHSPNGRGVMLIKEMMTRVQYNHSGTEVVMYKQRNQPLPSDQGE